MGDNIKTIGGNYSYLGFQNRFINFSWCNQIHESQIKMSDSSDFDGSFVPNKASRRKSSNIYSDEDVWESDEEDFELDISGKSKNKKSKKFIVSDSEGDADSDEDFSSPKKSRKSKKKIETDSESETEESSDNDSDLPG